MKFGTMYFKFRKSQDLETKRSGMELIHTPERKIDPTATQMVERFKETGHAALKSISALSRGIPKRKNNRDTMHFNAHASNTDFFFKRFTQQISSVFTEQLRIGVKSSV